MVRDLVADLDDAAAGKTYEGFKGGPYPMGPGTALWVSRYGHVDYGVITHITARDEAVVLHCIDIEPWR